MIAWSFKGRENLNFSTYEKLFERSKVQDYHHGITSGMRAVTFGVSQDRMDLYYYYIQDVQKLKKRAKSRAHFMSI